MHLFVRCYCTHQLPTVVAYCVSKLTSVLVATVHIRCREVTSCVLESVRYGCSDASFCSCSKDWAELSVVEGCACVREESGLWHLQRVRGEDSTDQLGPKPILGALKSASCGPSIEVVWRDWGPKPRFLFENVRGHCGGWGPVPCTEEARVLGACTCTCYFLLLPRNCNRHNFMCQAMVFHFIFTLEMYHNSLYQ